MIYKTYINKWWFSIRYVSLPRWLTGLIWIIPFLFNPHPVFVALILNGDSCWYLRQMCLKMGYTSKISILMWKNYDKHHWISRSPTFRQTNGVYHWIMRSWFIVRFIHYSHFSYDIYSSYSSCSSARSLSHRNLQNLRFLVNPPLLDHPMGSRTSKSWRRARPLVVERHLAGWSNMVILNS